MKQLTSVLLCGICMACTSLPEISRFEGRFIYSDGSAQYRFPQVPERNEPVMVKLRVKAYSVDTVILHYQGNEVPMLKAYHHQFFDWYIAEIPPHSSTVYYWFEVAQGNSRLFYSRRGIELTPPPSSTQFKIIPGFTVPEWMKGAVLYQIFIDRFANGDDANDVVTNEYLYDTWPAVQISDWNAEVDANRSYAEGSNRTREFYGGDLQGIIDKLDYLAEMGIEGLYLNPIFVSPSNHKYDTQDYRYVDPHFGRIVVDGGQTIDPEEDENFLAHDFSLPSSINKRASKYILRTTDERNLVASNELFDQLVARAHEKGIKIILDGVFNHTGSFHQWMNREEIYGISGAYGSKNSPYRNYFMFQNEQAWPKNESYEAWYGIPTLPKLNLEGSPSLEKEILDIAEFWISRGADGWRLDVAAEIGHSSRYNHLFFQKLRTMVKNANPEAVILAEVYGDSSAWLDGTQWDTVMNYDAFMEPVSWYLTGLEKHSYEYRADLHNNTEAFVSTLQQKMATLPWQSLEIAMNQLDNHDHSRFLTRTSHIVDTRKRDLDMSDPAQAANEINKGILKEATVIQMLLPGAPTLYYGDEAGVAGFTDPDNRRTYPWGNEDEELLQFFKEIIRIHKDSSALRRGSYLTLQQNGKGVFAAARWDRNSTIIAITNNNAESLTLPLDVSIVGLADTKLRVLLESKEKSHRLSGEAIPVDSEGRMKVQIPAWGALILEGPGQEEPIDFTSLRPRITAVSPRTSAEPIEVIQISFSYPMQQRDIIDAFHITPKIKGKFSWNGSTVTFHPSQALPSGQTIRVTVDPTLRSRKGQLFLSQGSEWSFVVK